MPAASRVLGFFAPLSLATALTIIGCSSGGGDSLETPDDPTVEGPVAGPVGPFVAGTAGVRLSDVGYRQVELFVSGTASSFANVDELGTDGRWEVEAVSTAEYKTRALVYRPIASDAFSGIVIVEWLNVSGGLDAAPDWISLHTEIVREGHVWVGVSAQIDGIEGREGGIGGFHLKAANPERYGSLSHPGDSFSYDMFAQVAHAVRDPVGVAPLEDLVARRVIAAGESQSAGRLITWINAFAVRYRLFDGYIVHSRVGGSAPLSQSPQDVIATPSVVHVRDDLAQPTLMFQTESDLLILSSLASNQPDSENFRLWEVAGTAHADVYTLRTGHSDLGDDPSVARVLETTEGAPINGLITCERPINAGPAHWVLKAGLHGLVDWIENGNALPEAPRLLVTEDGEAFELDALGNVLGGIRTNYVDVPVAVLSGLGQTGESFCRIFGTTALFEEAQLADLYPTEQDYIDAVAESLQGAVNGGFLLPADAALIERDAETSGIGGAQ